MPRWLYEPILPEKDRQDTSDNLAHHHNLVRPVDRSTPDVGHDLLRIRCTNGRFDYAKGGYRLEILRAIEEKNVSRLEAPRVAVAKVCFS